MVTVTQGQNREALASHLMATHTQVPDVWLYSATRRNTPHTNSGVRAVTACVWHMVTRTETRRHTDTDPPCTLSPTNSCVTWHHAPAWQTHASARPQPPCDLHNANARPLHKGCLAPPTRSQVEWGREPREMPGLPGERQMPSDSACRFVAQLLGFKSFYY